MLQSSSEGSCEGGLKEFVAATAAAVAAGHISHCPRVRLPESHSPRIRPTAASQGSAGAVCAAAAAACPPLQKTSQALARTRVRALFLRELIVEKVILRYLRFLCLRDVARSGFSVGPLGQIYVAESAIEPKTQFQDDEEGGGCVAKKYLKEAGRQAKV